MQENKAAILNRLMADFPIGIFRLEEDNEALFGDYQRYDFYQLVWFQEVGNDPTYFIDFNEYTLEDGQIVLVFPGQIDRPDTEGKKGFLFTIRNDVFFNINQRINSDFLNGYFSNVFVVPDKETKDILDKLMLLILPEYSSQKREMLLEAYMQVFLYYVSSLFENSNIGQRNDTVVAEIMKLIDRNFINEKETDFYAEKLGLSNRRINELCKQGTGKTVKQHLQERLILEIKKEIRLREKSLKEIAFDLGFNEPAYFTRFFKQHTSLTPTEFRDA